MYREEVYEEEKAFVVLVNGGQTFSLRKGESVSVRYKEEVGSFFMMRRECLSFLYGGGRLLLCTKVSVSLLYR